MIALRAIDQVAIPFRRVGEQVSGDLEFTGVDCHLGEKQHPGKVGYQELRACFLALFDIDDRSAVSAFIVQYLDQQTSQAKQRARFAPSLHPLEQLLQFLRVGVRAIFFQQGKNGFAVSMGLDHLVDLPHEFVDAAGFLLSRLPLVDVRFVPVSLGSSRTLRSLYIHHLDFVGEFLFDLPSPVAQPETRPRHGPRH